MNSIRDVQRAAAVLCQYASARVAGGLGTVALVVGDAQEIYDHRISWTMRCGGSKPHKLYHRALRNSLPCPDRFWRGTFDRLPFEAFIATGSRDERPRADVVIGDRYGTSCATVVIETGFFCVRLATASAATSSMPAASSPNITAIRPAGLHALQIEFNRALYMDERHYERIASIPATSASDIDTLADRLGYCFRWTKCGLTALPPNNSLTLTLHGGRRRLGLHSWRHASEEKRPLAN